MITFYCLSCGHKSTSDKQRCQVCGASNRFCSEEKYGDEMIALLSHKFRDYRLDALHKIRELRYEPAIPAIQALMAKERDPIIHREAIRTLKEIKSYQGRHIVDELADSISTSGAGFDFYTPQIGLIDVTQILKNQDHRKLRNSYQA